jgi:hypothetical protein
MSVGKFSLALSRFAASRPSSCFVLFRDKTGDYRIFHETHDSKWPKELATSTRSALHRYNALLSAFSVILKRVFLNVISVIIKGAIVSPHAPSKVSRRITRVHCTYRKPDRPQTHLFFPRKGAEVPDLHALELCKTWGFSGNSTSNRCFCVEISTFAGGSEAIWTK